MKRDGISRRNMMIAAGIAPLASLASAATPKAQGQPMAGNAALPEPADKQMRWAIVGLGSFAIGQVIPGFDDAKSSRITALVSGNAEKAAKIAAPLGQPKIYNYENFDSIANDPEIDCVYIVLPVGLHAEYTIRALKAGKHVLCEKPMASTSAECVAMIAAAKAAKRQLGVAYRVHFEPTNVEALRRIKAGEIGTMRHVSGDAGFNANPEFPPHKWRLTKALGGGGSMYDIGVYALNGSLMMMDEMPIETSAVYSTPKGDPRFTEVEGGIDWRLRFPSGISAQGSSSYTYGYITRQRFFGSDGAVTLEPASTYYDNNLTLNRNGQPEAVIQTGNPASQFAAQVDAFSRAARDNVAHRTPGEMGLRDIRIIEAMYRSADNGGIPVKL